MRMTNRRLTIILNMKQEEVRVNYAANWNRLDSIIFFCENKLTQVKTAISDSREEEPDVELMIQVETEHLREENESLKRRELPVHLIEREGEYICPKCHYKLSDLQVRYCANCGHRVICVDEKKGDKNDVYI